LVAVYGVANQRYMSNTSLQWQIPLYAVPAQVALVVGVTATEGTTSILLGSAAALIGLVAVLVMRRIELTAQWDRRALDEFEAVLLPDRPALHLMHASQFRDRVRAKPLPPSRSLLKRWEARWSLYPPPSFALMLLILTVGFAALGIAIQRQSDHPTKASLPHHRELVKVSKITL
jgi:hypothetical protein